MSVSNAFTQKYLNQYVQSPSNGYTLPAAAPAGPSNLTLLGSDLTYPNVYVDGTAITAASTLTLPAAADILANLQSSSGASPASYPWVVPCNIKVKNTSAQVLTIAAPAGGSVVNGVQGATATVSATAGSIKNVCNVSVVFQSATTYDAYLEGTLAA